MNSKNSTYWLVGGLVIFVIALGIGYKTVRHYQRMNTASQPLGNGSAMYGNQSGTSQTVTPGAMTGHSAMTQNTSTANSQLDQDLQNIQGNLDQLQTDQTNSTQSLQNQSSDVVSPQ